MSDMQKSVRFSFGNPSRLDYCVQPYPDGKAGTLIDQGRHSTVFNVDKYNTSGYVYPIQICRDVKKAGHVDPLSLDTDGWNRHCFRYATTEPEATWNIMDVIKPYRRAALRLRLYSLSLHSPVKPLQPVFSCGRDPPTN